MAGVCLAPGHGRWTEGVVMKDDDDDPDIEPNRWFLWAMIGLMASVLLIVLR
jgi:hypothetical protein